VVGGVKAEGLAREAGGDEGLNDAVGGPGLLAAGFEGDRGFEGDGGDPEGVHAGGVGGEDGAEDSAFAEVGEGSAVVFAVAAVEDGEVEAAGEAGDDDVDLVEDSEDLGGVVAAEGDGHAGGGGEGVDVVVERLLRVADGERAFHEELAGFFAERHQLLDGELFEDGVVHAADVSADEA
jgi:hypothetical protein